MIDRREAWIKDSLMLKDSEKFKVMVKVYESIFVNKEHFSKKIKVGRSTVFGWFKKDKTSFNTKAKVNICQAFNLLDTVWSDAFMTVEAFEERLSEYKKVGSIRTIREENILVQLKKSRKGQAMELDELSKEEVDALLSNKLEKESSSFMFAFAKALKHRKQIKEALEVLDLIEREESSFKYTHENQIRHERAILLSTDSIKDWDGAIHILRSLYHSRNYHLEEPEILTLLASNYKRKALENYSSNAEIDMTLMTSALCLYEDAYQLKPDNDKYYDAINLAYLYNMTDAIEHEHADKVEIETLYKELLKIWRIDKESWWEVSSDAEFLMLLGRVDLAIFKINEFFEKHKDTDKIKAFNTEDVLFRQLELYIKVTADANAVKFLKEVRESWKYLS